METMAVEYKDAVATVRMEEKVVITASHRTSAKLEVGGKVCGLMLHAPISSLRLKVKGRVLGKPANLFVCSHKENVCTGTVTWSRGISFSTEKTLSGENLLSLSECRGGDFVWVEYTVDCEVKKLTLNKVKLVVRYEEEEEEEEDEEEEDDDGKEEEEDDSKEDGKEDEKNEGEHEDGEGADVEGGEGGADVEGGEGGADVEGGEGGADVKGGDFGVSLPDVSIDVSSAVGEAIPKMKAVVKAFGDFVGGLLDGD
eukprot:Sspe_Gene.62869::Locus_35592_Transcript_3_3_Confidence_0.714_Length_1674::g.62869::m.62869